LDRKRANQIERYVLVATGAGLLLLFVALVVNSDPQPSLARKQMFTYVLMLAAGAFGGAMPGAIMADGTPSAATKAIGVIGLALAVGFMAHWFL
jgi:hypothetical protein